MASSEQDIIERFFRPLAGPEGLGFLDDVALLRPQAGFDLIVTTDMISEGMDFLDDPPEAIAAKALRINLSDVCAKGGEPIGYVMSVGLPGDVTEEWLTAFAKGLAADQERYSVWLYGGDTNRVADGVVISVTAIGRVPGGEVVPRTGARPGDVVVVSGTIGDAALGLLVRRGTLAVSEEARTHLLQRLHYPDPPLALGPVLRRRATAAMDISDGLAGDLGKLCLASGVSAQIDVAKVPLSAAARAAVASDSALLETALTGGEDFEILATLPEDTLADFLAAAQSAGVAVTEIGRITRGKEAPIFLDGDGNAMTFAQASYDHFAGNISS